MKGLKDKNVTYLLKIAVILVIFLEELEFCLHERLGTVSNSWIKSPTYGSKCQLCLKEPDTMTWGFQGVCCELVVLSTLQDASTEVFVSLQSITLSAPLTPSTGKRLCPQSHEKHKYSRRNSTLLLVLTCTLEVQDSAGRAHKQAQLGIPSKGFGLVVRCPELDLAKLCHNA